MSLRKDAISWYEKHVGKIRGHVFTSKFYTPDESWSGRNAWWLQIPVERFMSDRNSVIHLICQSAPNNDDYYCLSVPSMYFVENLSQLSVIGQGKVSLFLSAEPQNLFADERGSGRLKFDNFLVNSSSSGK